MAYQTDLTVAVEDDIFKKSVRLEEEEAKIAKIESEIEALLKNKEDATNLP